MNFFLKYSLLGIFIVSSGLCFSDLHRDRKEGTVLSRSSSSSQGGKKRYEVVGVKGNGPGYAKIQDAIEAARIEGASSEHPAVVIVEPGKYEENLTLYDGIEIEGPDGEPLAIDPVEISGNHTLPREGSVVLKNLTFQMPHTEEGSHFGYNDPLSTKRAWKEKLPESLIFSPTGRTEASLTNTCCGTSITTTPDAVLIGGPSNSIVSLPLATNGQLVIGNTGNAPSVASLTAGSGITITPGPGTLQIASTGSGITTTQHALLIGGAGNTVNSLPVATTGQFVVGNTAADPTLVGPLTNGQLLIGSTGAVPVAASLTAGTNITITPGAGSISIASVPFNNTDVQTFAVHGTSTYTPNANMVYCFIQVVGAGGGGGGGGNTTGSTISGGSGGGAGGYAAAWLTKADVGASLPVIVGQGGGGVAGGAGGNGGLSSVGGTLIQATGGSGGAIASPLSSIFAAGGVGGVGTGGDYLQYGQNGGGLTGSVGSGYPNIFGLGAPGPFSQGAFTPSTSGSSIANGVTANGNGGGGSGGFVGTNNSSGTATGGSGSDGIVIIIEFNHL